MNNLPKNILIAIISILVFASCTLQKKRYSMGYHVNWHHSKKSNLSDNRKSVINQRLNFASLKSITSLHKDENINRDRFSKQYPSSHFTIATEPKSKRELPHPITDNIESLYYQPNLDSQAVLTKSEIEKNYFINKKGEKKKYLKGLRLGLIIGGAITLFTPVVFIGLPALIIGLLLPHPKKDTKQLSPQLSDSSKKDNQVIKAILIIAVVIVLLLAAFAIALAISGSIAGF